MKKISDKITNYIRTIHSFGITLAFSKLCNIMWSYERHPGEFAWLLFQNRVNITISVIEKKYGKIIKDFQKYSLRKEVDIDVLKDLYIWTMWWQGEMPELVKMCISAMKVHSGGKQVIVLTEKNYRNYIEIPEYITKKIEKGLISLTHLSDIVRMCVLEKWGGCWLDATVLPIRNIDEVILRSAYYTGKLPQKRIECISYGRWCGFLMSGDPNGILFRFASEFLREYWKRENCLIDYFLIDYIIQLAYLHFNEFYEQYHSIPYNNPDILELEKLLNDEIDYDTFEEMTLNTSFFKLNWKATHTKKTQRGTSTYYGYLVDKYLTM